MASGPQNPGQSPYPRPNMGANMGGKRGDVSMEIIGETWRIISSNWGPFIKAALAAVLPALVVYVIGHFLFYGNLAELQAEVQRNPNSPDMGKIGQMYQVIGIMMLFNLIAFCFYGPAQASMARMGLILRRGGTLSAGDEFWGFKRFFSNFTLALVQGISTGLGFFCCCIGLFVVGGLVNPAWGVVADDDSVSPVEAISRSVEVMKPKMWMATLLFLVLVIIGNAAGIAFGMVPKIGPFLAYIPNLFMMGFMPVGMAFAYDDMIVGGPHVPSMQVMPTGAPTNEGGPETPSS